MYPDPNAEGYFRFLPGRESVLSLKTSIPEVRRQRLTRCFGAEGELEFSAAEDTVAGTLLFRIQVGEPTNSSTWVALELLAFGINEIKVSFLLLYVGDGVGGG